jgi:hypothetical protein
MRDDIWTAYLMFIESDGNNARQLIHYVRVDIFTSEFVARGARMHGVLDEDGSWNVDRQVHALGLRIRVFPFHASLSICLTYSLHL